MGIFYSAVMDDPLDSSGDGRIIGGSTTDFIQGPDGRNRPIALVGHLAWCGACKSAGAIVAAPGSPHHNRMVDFTGGGAREALGGDLVMCKCERPPRIIPVYGRSSIVYSDAGPSAEASAPAEPTAVTPAASSGPGDYDEHFILQDQRSGQPVAGLAWGINTPDGQCEGCTDADGKTDIICGHEGESVKLVWVLQTEMGIRP